MNAKYSKTLILGFLLAVIGPISGIICTLIGFSGIKHAEPVSPEKLTAEIGTVIYPTLAGLSVGLIGLVILMVLCLKWIANRKSESKKI